MYSTEETQSHLSNSNQNPTPTPTPSSSSVHLRRLGERCSDNEEAMPRPFRLDQQEMELDLRAFEDRLVELAKETKPCSLPWLPICGTLFVCTAIGACHWLPKVRESQSILLRGLASRGALTLSLATIALTIFFAARHINQPQPGVVELSKDTLALFHLQCDTNGHILRIPRTDPVPDPLRSRRSP